jgi:lysophospholipase L1-like esterase
MKSEDNGFSNNPFMIGYDNRIFEGDDNLGFKFPGDRLISKEGFVELDKIIIKVMKNTGYPVILNMGDSSTSGWDSNKTFKGNENLNAPFFNYKTYSDLLEEQLFANVINAGVPGYTTYQGRKSLEILLKRLATEEVKADYVTIYFGNNDCTYNQIEDKVRIDRKKPSSRNRGERVSLADYKRNIKSMIKTAREYGVKPILIVPPVHHDWEPGIRADKHREESVEILKQLGDSPLAKELQTAKGLYIQGKYRQACEKDRVLPRLKEKYRKALICLARETKTCMIDIQGNIPLTDNSDYFADYCHPIEKTNQMIVDRFIKIRNKDIFHKPFLSKIKDWFKILYQENIKDAGRPPKDTYTMY